jgi:hypothetical protein
MKTFSPDKDSTKARLSVKMAGGIWTLADGKPLPTFKPGASAELVISPWDIVDDFERARLLKESFVEFLPAETSIWARVKDDDIPSDLRRSRHQKSAGFESLSLFVEIRLVSAVSLVIRGDGRAALSECSCRIPALPDLRCSSINEAYTRISESFEPSRRSHTGNIFNCVFYERGRWLAPLRELRDETLLQPTPETSSV